MLAFVHIEKTAGTTLIHILRQSFFPRYLDVRPLTPHSAGQFKPDDLRWFRRLNPALLAFGGHAVVPYAGLETVDADIQYITILRDPLRRYVSQYMHWVTRMGSHLSFEEFLANRKTWNVQTRKICGSECWEAAYCLLNTHFLACGIMERFDEFLALLSLRLAGNRLRIGYAAVNVGFSNVDAATLLHRFRAQIEDANRADIALYRRVTDDYLLGMREQYGPRLTMRLEELRRRQPGWERSASRLADFAMRRSIVEPTTGFLRLFNGLTYHGSYGRIEKDWESQ